MLCRGKVTTNYVMKCDAIRIDRLNYFFFRSNGYMRYKYIYRNVVEFKKVINELKFKYRFSQRVEDVFDQ